MGTVLKKVERKFISKVKSSEKQELTIGEFLSMSKNDQAIVLMNYAKTQSIVHRYGSKYYSFSKSNVRLEKDNFQGLLLETIARVLNKVNENNSLSGKKNVKRKIHQDEDLNFSKMSDVYGYLVNAYKTNVKKNYTPETAEKRKNCKGEVSLSQPNTSSSDKDMSTSIIDSYGASFDFIEDLENQTIIRDVLKALFKYDQVHETQYNHLLNEYIKTGGNATEVAENFNLQIYQLTPKLKEINEILKGLGLSESFHMALSSASNLKEKNRFEIKYKQNEKQNNKNFNNTKYELIESHGIFKGHRQVIISVIEKNYSSELKKETFVFNLENGKKTVNESRKHETDNTVTIVTKNINSKHMPTLDEKVIALDCIKNEIQEIKVRYAIC